MITIDRNEGEWGTRAEDYRREPTPARLNRGVGVSMMLAESPHRVEPQKSKTRVGGETLNWLNGEVSLDADNVSSTTCRLSSMADTNGVLSLLNSEVGDQLREGRAVVALEIVNWLNSEFEPDETIVNSDPDVPAIYRVDHSMKEGGISLFFAKRRGQVEGSDFFMTACRKERSERLLAELGKHGYTTVIDNPAHEKADEQVESGNTHEVVLIAA